MSEAACPNIGECWAQKHATVMILGDTCTRACAFCNVKTGTPLAVDPRSPHLAEAMAAMGLEHVVITSVDRDDLPDGGAFQFVRCIEAIRAEAPGTTIEILTPDFLRKPGAVEAIVRRRPDVYNHNLETVPRLYRTVRPGARYFHSLRLLQGVKELDPSLFTKSGSWWAGRGEARGPAGDGRHALGRDRLPHRRTVPAADAATTRLSGSSSPRSSTATPARRAPRFLVVFASPLPARPTTPAPTSSACAPRAGTARRWRHGRPLGLGAGSMPTHAEKRRLPYRPEQMFDLVAESTITRSSCPGARPHASPSEKATCSTPTW